MDQQHLQTLRSPEAAQYIGMSDAWLRKARMNRDPLAPPYIQIGSAIRYLRADLDAWLESRRVQNDRAV
jgi:predicted DNA-binding transcriptional regulator AlpA